MHPFDVEARVGPPAYDHWMRFQRDCCHVKRAVEIKRPAVAVVKRQGRAEIETSYCCSVENLLRERRFDYTTPG